MKVVGIDLGGTNFAVGVVNEEGKILSRESGKTMVKDGPEAVAERLSQAVKKVLAQHNVEAVGIGSPGSIDHTQGVVRFSPNFPGWHDFPLADRISQKTGLKVYVENDANAYALGEHTFGIGKGYDHIVCLTLGTGVGGGVISHGLLLRGSVGIGAELGHIKVMPNGPICGCGSRGCLEAFASATALKRFVQEGFQRHKTSALYDGKKPEEVTPEDIFRCAKNGDEFAKSIVSTLTDALAVAIGTFVNIFNPQLVILGGGISNAGAQLLDPLVEKVKDHVLPSMLGTFEIKLSKLGKDAGILGAASIVIERMKNK